MDLENPGSCGNKNDGPDESCFKNSGTSWQISKKTDDGAARPNLWGAFSQRRPSKCASFPWLFVPVQLIGTTQSLSRSPAS